MKKKLTGTGLALCCIFLITSYCTGQQMQLRVPGHGTLSLNVKQFGVSNGRQHRVVSPQLPASCSNDSVYLTRQSQIDSFPIANPTCTVLRKLIIDGSSASPAITRLDSLKYVTEVTELLSVTNTSVTNLSPLLALTKVGGNLDLRYNPLLSGIGLNNLTQLGGLYLQVLPALTDLNGISNHIDTIGGHIHIDSVGVTSLTGLNGIVYINGDLSIAHTALTTLGGINSLQNLHYLYLDSDTLLTTIGLTNIDSAYGFLFGNLPLLPSLGALSYHLTNKDIGTFWFINTPLLTDFTGMDSIHSAANFYIWFNNNLTSLQGLHHLNGNVPFGISVWYNQNLTDISALQNITSVSDDKLEVNDCDLLTDLSGLQNISAAAALWITRNDALTSLSGLNSGLSVTNTTGDSLRIFENPQVSVCNIPAVCNYFSSHVGSAEIYNNAPGCNDTLEVISNCGSLNCTGQNLKIWNGSFSQYWNDSLNWTPHGVPQPCDSVLIPENLSDYPVLTSNQVISGLRMESNTNLDQNGFNLSVYGNVWITSATIGGAPGHLLIRNSHDTIHIDNSNIFPFVTIEEYSGTLELWNNTIDNDIAISDAADRTAANDLYGNFFNNNFTITANSTSGETHLCNGDDDYVFGDVTLTVNQPVNFDFSSAFHIGGNFTVNSNYPGYPNTNNGAFDFISGNNSTAHITKTGDPIIKFGNLYTNKWGEIILDQDLYISNNAQFGSGIVRSDSSKLLIFENNTSITQYSSASYVDGPVRKIGNQAFRFPVGDSIYQAVCDISSPQNLTDTFTVRYFKGNPSLNGYDTSSHASSLNSVSGKEYWKINYTHGASVSNVKVTLSYDSSRSAKPLSIYQLRVAKWSGSLWQNQGASLITGDDFQSFITTLNSETGYGIYTLGIAPLRLPVITISPADTLACAGFSPVPFRAHFTLDTLMFPNNVFKLQISDSSGSFASPVEIGSVISNHSDSITGSIPLGFLYSNHYKIRVVGNQPPDTSAPRTITVKPFPNAVNTISGTAAPCIGGGVYKYWISSPQPGITYNWTLSTPLGTITSNYDTAYVTWTTPGNTSVNVQGINSCIAGSFTNFFVTILPPKPTATPVINNIGRWLYSSAPAPNQNSLGYHWYRNDTLISGANSSSYYATGAGIHKVKYYNLCGESPASNTISFAVASVPQTINFPAIVNKVYSDPPFVPSATATSGLPVSFSIVSGPASINPVTNLLTILGVGNVTIRATQAGDNVYDTAAPVTQTFAVGKAPQTISFPVITDKDFANTTSFTISATASSGLTVTYSLISGPATLSGSTVTLTGLGTVTIRASQPGDTNYLAAPAVDRSFCVRVSALNPITGPNSICPGVNATYSVNNIPGANYTWRIAGGSTLPSTTNTVTTTWPAPGNYTLIVSAAGSCGAPSNNDSLAIVAITSAQPDSVHGMLPANNAVNQPLPLTMSWIPANPNLNYTFDIYIWRADTLQPATPFISGITTVSYTIPVNAGLLFNRTYKWMVVAHNGSCTVITTGPVQQFTLLKLPDLQPVNVIAPSSAISGQNVAVNWTVKNNGPGTTGTTTWTDAVFFSFDSLPNFNNPPETNPNVWSNLQFPLRPLLVGSRPNVSALDSGQQYSNSVNFTLPVSYSQPLYAYVISDYPHTGNSPYQTTYSNDTARAPQPTNVSLAPQPDLRVDTVFTPASTFTGSTINLTYKVKNYGVLTPSGNAWIDKIYISNSPFFSVNTAIQLKLPRPNGTYYFFAADALVLRNTQLQHDSSYTQNLQAVIPNFLTPGNYYIYVFTNATGSLYEGANANNNVNYNLMQAFLTPTPVLTVSSLTVPYSTVSTTQSIGVNWNIKNTGFNDNIEKNKGHYGVQGASCGVNSYTLSDSLGWGSSYWKDKVYLSRDTVLNVNNAVYMGPYLHGGDRNNALNAGYFSDNPSPFGACFPATTNFAALSINTQNVIYPGKDFPTNLNITIPDTLSAGNYYVFVYANPEHEVFEYPGNSQVRRSALPITVQKPDIIVSTVSVPPTATGGQPVNINYTITNNGPGAVYNHVRNDRIFVSTSPVFDNSAQQAGTFTYTENLPVGTGVQHSVNYTFPPATSGTRYIYVQVNYDSSFKEINQSNNTSTAAVISVTQGSPADLIVSGITLADTVFTVYQQQIKYTVTNNGPASTNGNWTDSIFISCSPSYSSSTATFIGKRNHSNVMIAGSSYNDSLSFSLAYSFYVNGCFPQTQDANAYFFVKTNADAGVYEGANGGNNMTGSGLRDLRNPFPDHIVTNVSGGDSAVVGRVYTVSWTDKNIGYNPGYAFYNAWADYVYFSPDSVYNNNAVYASYFYEASPLNAGQSLSDTKPFTVPVLPTGDYYVLSYTNRNNSFIESNLNNNINLLRNGAGAAKKIHITQPLLPDLSDSILAVSSSVALGQPLSLTNRVINNGVGVTYPNSWSDYLWLSTDFIPNNGNDILLYQKVHTGSLLPGQFYNDTILTNAIPVNTPPGNYILIAQTNGNGDVTESNSGNNLSFRYLNVFSPAPSDLVVENIQHPDSVYLGFTIDTAKWTVFNNSPNAAIGVSTDGIYLSRNTVLDSTAVLIGLKNKNMAMGPLSRDTISFTPRVTGVTEGNYNILVKTDLLNNIIETNENNNAGVSVTPIYVKVKPLPLNVLTPSTLQFIPRYFKLRIPDSLIGSTIIVTLKSSDSLTVANQLFIGSGYIPSAAHFDYTYPTANYGNQQIIMSSVTDSVYYVTVNCASLNSPVQNITLQAQVLPFAIVSVDANAGGNIGNVTIRIIGSLFTNNMTGKLVKPGTTITASAVYYVNSTTVFATFNLQGRPLGIYDVRLEKPDLSTALLINGFSVVNPNNGGLLTGGGVNTGPGNGNQPGCDPGAAAGLNSQLSIEIVVPEKVFGGWPFPIQINFSNPTNYDIPAQTRTLYSLDNIPVALTQAGLNGAGASLYLVLTEPNGPPGIIRAGGTGTILVYSQAPVTFPAHRYANFSIR